MFCPDITVLVDWALNTKLRTYTYLFVYIPLHLFGIDLHCTEMTATVLVLSPAAVAFGIQRIRYVTPIDITYLVNYYQSKSSPTVLAVSTLRRLLMIWKLCQGFRYWLLRGTTGQSPPCFV